MDKDNKFLTKEDCDKEIKRFENLVKEAPKNESAKLQLDYWKGLRAKEFGDK